MYIQEQQNKKGQLAWLNQRIRQTEGRGKKNFKEGKYAASIIDGKEFYHASKCLEAQSKQPKIKTNIKQRKGNKSNAAETLTDDKAKILYEKYLH